MRRYSIKGEWHYVYENDDEIPVNIDIVEDWRKGTKGDWVRAADGNVIQILREGRMSSVKLKRGTHKTYLGTCTGTFISDGKKEMHTRRRRNIYTFAGDKHWFEHVAVRKNCTQHERLFALNLAAGLSPKDAYLKSYPNVQSEKMAAFKARGLIKTERIQKAMREDLKPVLKELGISKELVLKGIKDKAETSEKEDTSLKAWFKLADILDLEDKTSTKVTQVTGAVFQGFSDAQLEGAERPELIGSSSIAEEDSK